MSHYLVAVFHRCDQTVDELLAPYDENLRVAPYISFTRQEAIDYARKHYDTEGKTDEECWQLLAEDHETDNDGNIYSTYNPKSKWDWYTEGGWGDMLLCNGEPVCSGRVGDLTFPFDEDTYKESLRFWDVVVDHKPADPGEDFHSIYGEKYYLDYYGNRESYAKHAASFTTYAVLTPDGVWHAPGEMGWFGCSSENANEYREWCARYKERFIDAADPDWMLTVVDCHI